MSSVRIALLFPVLQVSIAMALLWHGNNYSYTKKALDTPYVPTSTLVCSGLSAPAFIVSRSIAPVLPPYAARPNRGVTNAFGKEDVLFLVFIALLWYLVGRTIDIRLWSTGVGREGQLRSVWQGLALLLFSFAVLALGIVLLRDPDRFNNWSGTIAEGCMFVIWALVLATCSGIAVLRGTRSSFR